MAKFAAGGNPADHTVAEVNEFLKGDEVTGDEYDRVMAAEREGKNRIGIMSGSGQEEAAPAAPAVEDAAGPNEAATGQESPADEASDVDDPQASGDASETADQYADDDPASLGPEKPQSEAEADESVAGVVRASGMKTQTAAQALQEAVNRTQALMGRGPYAQTADNS